MTVYGLGAQCKVPWLNSPEERAWFRHYKVYRVEGCIKHMYL